MSLNKFFHTVKWFHLFLSNTNTQLRIKIILSQTIQFSINTEFFFCLQTFKSKNSSISNNSV